MIERCGRLAKPCHIPITSRSRRSLFDIVVGHRGMWKGTFSVPDRMIRLSLALEHASG